MVYLIMDNLILILLTIVGALYSNISEVYIIIGAALMIFVTYQKYNESKRNNLVLGANLVGMLLYACFSGSIFGFFVFGMKMRFDTRLILHFFPF